MPTSAACSASASLTPSPRKATPPPPRRCTRTMRAFCSGLTRAKTVVSAIAAASRVVVHGVHPRRSARRLDAEPRSRQTLIGDGGVVPGHDLDRDPERRRAGAALAAASALGGSRNTSRPTSAQAVLVGGGRRGQPGGRPAGHRHDPVAGGELRRQRVPGRGRDVDAAGQHRFGCTLRHQESRYRRRPGRRPRPAGARGRTAAPRALVAPSVARSAAAAGESHSAWSSALPPTPRPVALRCTAGPSAAAPRLVPRPPARPACSRCALGQRAGLVGEQHVDVAEVLDAHQSFDQHLALPHPRRSGGEAGRHHRGQQLRGDADRDGQREQQRVEDRLLQHAR